MPEGVKVLEFRCCFDGLDSASGNPGLLVYLAQPVLGAEGKAPAFIQAGSAGIQLRRGIPEGIDEAYAAARVVPDIEA